MRKMIVLSAMVLSLVMLASQGFADEGGAGKGAVFTVLLPVIGGDSSVPLSEAV